MGELRLLLCIKAIKWEFICFLASKFVPLPSIRE